MSGARTADAAYPAAQDAEEALAGPEAAQAPATLPLDAGLNALAIDTTSDVLSLALLRDGAPAGAQYEAIGRRTTQEILPRIAGLLDAAGLSVPALDVLVVARGPGSFTGTRIGMAVALTFAQATGRPLVGVDTLRLLAAQAEPAPGESRPGKAFAVLLNCARDEVYHARYRWTEAGLARESGIVLQDLPSLLPALGDTPVVLRRFRPGVGTPPEVEAAFAALPRTVLRHPAPDGERLLAVGLGRFLATRDQPWPPVAPIYLKSEAFRTWKGAP